MGIAPAKFYKYKAKYWGFDNSDVQKLKSLEEKDSSLKRMYLSEPTTTLNSLPKFWVVVKGTWNEIQFIQPGRPMQNWYIKRFKCVHREAILDTYLFNYIRDVRALIEEWIEEINERRPHEALQNRTPSEWKQQIQP